MVHLKERGYYEDIYDRLTVEWGRRNTETFNELYDKFFEIMPDEPRNSHRAVLHLNIVYMVFVGNELIERYDSREGDIHEMMAKDEAKDRQIANARLTVEPVCQHCHVTGLRLTDKMLSYRDSFDKPEEVLFFLKCSKCEKNTAVWSDGKPLEPKKTLCPKCNAEMSKKDSRKGKVITTTYTCHSCGHQYKDKLDFSPEKKEVDPDFEADRAIYCLHDEKVLNELRDAKWRFEEMAKMGKEWKEKEDNKHIYDAIAELKKPKIPELIPLLQPIFEAAGYVEFGLDKPETGKIVYVGFSCLDSKSDRDDRDSRKTLQTALRKALGDTNWRLTNEGISYRLGYLTGRLRAYEDEEELKKLVLKNGIKTKPSMLSEEVKKNAYRIKGKNGEEIIL
ncbi:MAG: hypothetical protein QG640_616 [Patescibacteria group bacterium]|nr:hypothetical protein [Candidatus Saccharibacteria bacterium]MDQ5893604.1 hypothetical protein [Patescibacteria group bacterium]MDQ5963110.1 hypothetical protein [Patescibacteria group bacterium]